MSVRCQGQRRTCPCQFLGAPQCSSQLATAVDCRVPTSHLAANRHCPRDVLSTQLAVKVPAALGITVQAWRSRPSDWSREAVRCQRYPRVTVPFTDRVWRIGNASNKLQAAEAASLPGASQATSNVCNCLEDRVMPTVASAAAMCLKSTPDGQDQESAHWKQHVPKLTYKAVQLARNVLTCRKTHLNNHAATIAGLCQQCR